MKRSLATLVLAFVFFGFFSFMNALADQKKQTSQQQQLAIASSTESSQSQAAAKVTNPNVDMEGHLKLAAEAAKHRETRLVKENDFIKMAKERGTLVLDCRSKDRFEGLHIKGAKNLTFADITVESLNKMIPDKETKILIYCNNNFVNDPKNFPTKAFSAALNISTYIALYDYGYKNVYELGEVIDMKQPEKSKIVFEGTTLKN